VQIGCWQSALRHAIELSAAKRLLTTARYNGITRHPVPSTGTANLCLALLGDLTPILFGVPVMEPDRIHAAVTSLLNACYASDDPAATLRAELKRLRATGKCSELQMAQLEAMALRTVKSIVSNFTA
jgi:hypothetical protein